MIAIIKHVPQEGPGLFGGLFKEFGLPSRIIELSKNEPLPSPVDCQGILVMGGPMNVYETEKYPFLLKEDEFLKEALEKEVPLIGICLGAQLLAKAYGAKVYKAKEKEIGWFDVFLTGEAKSDPLFKGLKEKMPVFQWHEDTFDVPAGGCVLAEGDSVINQAARFGPCAWGLQFHPEMINQMIHVWLQDCQEPIDRNAIMYGYFKCQDLYLRQARMLCSNFSEVVRQHQSAASLRNK